MLSVCPHDCPSCCSLVVAVSDGRLTSVTGNPDHPFTQGVICGKVREYAERVHSPLRVLRPLRRVGPKGAGEFMPMSWDDAIETIAARWRAITAADGAEAILPFSYGGSMGQVQYFAGHPLFHALGASRLDRSICVSTAYAGWRVTVGQITGNDSEQMVGADLFWGVNASYSTPRSPADAGPPHDQHDPARTRPDGPDTGATGALTLRLQLEPGGRVPGPDARAPRARAGGSLHGRPRAGDDRHRALRRHRAAGDDLDGAPRSLLLVRPAHRAARAAGPAAAGRSEVQLGDLLGGGP